MIARLWIDGLRLRPEKHPRIDGPNLQPALHLLQRIECEQPHEKNHHQWADDDRDGGDDDPYDCVGLALFRLAGLADVFHRHDAEDQPSNCDG